MKRFVLIAGIMLADVTAAALIFGGSSLTTTLAARPSEAAQSSEPPRTWVTEEMRARQAIYDRVKALVEARDFAALNSMERQFLVTRARMPSGVWKLEQFHGAVHAALPVAQAADGCAFTAEPILKQWTLADPSAAAPYIAFATMLLDRAWCFRGDQYARDVPDDAWQPFHDNVNRAAELLATNKRAAAADPAYYAVTEDIYRAQGRRDELAALLKEASEREPFFYGLYWHSYLNYMPQWGGSHEEIEQGARFAVAKTQHQDGMGAYARYYWYASTAGCNCWAEAINWESMKLGMRDIAKQYPDAWNFANFARFACTFNDRETARIYFKALGKADGSDAWESEESYRRCREFAGA
jgi:hypothetical protein